MLNYLRESATFMSSFTLWLVDMPPTLFPVCLGFVSASHNFSTYYFMINASIQQSEKMKLSHIILYLLEKLAFLTWEQKHHLSVP